jgi:DUSP domain
MRVNIRPSAEDQKKTLEVVLTKHSHVVAGDTWYIISKKWFQDWENYVQNSTGSDGDAPGPIDNSPLINEQNMLLRDVDEYRCAFCFSCINLTSL